VFDLSQSTAIGSEFAIFLYRDDGTRIAQIVDVERFEYTKVVNGLGHFEIVLPHTFDPTLIARHRRVNIWRKPAGGHMAIDFAGLIKRIHRQDVNGVVVRMIGGSSLNGLLQQRIVAYPAGQSQSEKTDQIDDMMKAIVRENLGSLATDGLRQLSSTFFAVSSDVGLGPTATKGFSNKNMLAVLLDLSNVARQKGTEIYFDIVPVTETQMEFRTYLNQPGQDRTSTGSSPLEFSVERGNLLAPEYDEDFGEESNSVYAGGQGEGERRVLLSESSSEALLDAFARSEAFHDGRNEPDPVALRDAAKAELIERRPVRRFVSQIQQNIGSLYGLDWQLGDRVTATFDGLQFESLIRSVTVRVDGNGAEGVNSFLEAFV
jgi:hypothetical protein